jgi:hypothetical protein
MKPRIFLAVLLLVTPCGWCADVYVEKASPHKHCRLIGNAAPKSKKAAENVLKNRWHPPAPTAFDTSITTQSLIQPGNDPTRWSAGQAGRIRGYVAVVKANTEGESCNCASKKPIDCDTHIAVVPDRESLTDRTKYVFVEVTPRVREVLAAQNPPIDWSSDDLKKRLLGKRVEFEGWMFFDSAHTGQAVTTHPVDPKRRNWRATCWEVHPVTSIKLLGLFD